MEEKLRRLMKHEGINSTRLAEILGIQASGISHIMSGRNKPSYDFLIKLLQRFPQINPDWLLLDKGPMYRDEVKNRSGSVAQTGATNKPVVASNQEETGGVGLFAGSAAAGVDHLSAAGRTRVAISEERSRSLPGAEDATNNKGRFEPDDNDIIPSSTASGADRSFMPPSTAAIERQYSGFARSGTIERIVVFNKDKTFSEYRPE